jgi:exopolysaccharide biosynthesis polyprenyl glycosylphosphotransferase
MRNTSAEGISSLARALDLSALLLAFGLSAWLAAGDARHMPFTEVLALRVKLQNFIVFSAVLVAWTAMLTQLGLYRTYIYLSKAREVRDVVVAMSCCTVVLLLFHELLSIQLIGAGFLAVFWLFANGFAVAGRLLLRLSLRQARRSGQNVRHVLIVGTNRRALQLAQRFESFPQLGYRVLGFVDESWTGASSLSSTQYCVVTGFAGFPDYIARHVVDEVMLCLPIKSLYERSSQIVGQCEEQGITVRVVWDLLTPKLGQSHVERFDENVVLTVHTGGMRGGSMVVKRIIDLICSAIALLSLAPVMLIIAVLIRLRSPGPVFFLQDRMGLNKRRFRLYKFRTMVPDAEKQIAQLEHLNEVSGPVFKIRNDPRVTPLGRFLRKTSLDELPQLINVLMGDMSLVGPRPLPVRDYESFNTAWHRRRFSVKPGITCLWQVMGRNSIPFEQWMALDMQYIDQWSLLLDLQILVKTIPAVLKGSGAS